MTLPASWSHQRLDHIANLSRGKFSARPRNDSRFFGGDVPFVQTGDVRNAHVHLRDFSQTLNSEGVKVSRVFPRGTMLFTIAANIGDLAFLSFDAACPDSLVAIEPKQGIDERWLFYQLTAFKADFEAAATQNAQLNINLEKLNPFKIPVPPLYEQEAIAAALSDADGVAAGLERLIAKKRLIKQGAMQDLLTARRRLPGFSGEWEVKRLAQLGEVKTGLTYKPENVKPFGTLVLRSSNIQNDRLAFDNNVFVDVAVSDEATVKVGDLLICVRNGSRQLIGKTAMIDGRAGGMAFGAFMSAFRSQVNDYLLWCFQSSVVQDQIAQNLGATINQITNKTMKAIEISLPKDEKERRAITAVLSDMDAEIQTLESRLIKARAVKEGMMQNLLTGRVRLV